MTAAREFLKKINHEGLPLFNPLHGEGGTGKKGSKTSGGNESKEVKWNPIAKQLYNAIMWVIVIIDAKPNTEQYMRSGKRCGNLKAMSHFQVR